MCPTNDGIETTEHCLLICPSFEVERQNLIARVFELLRLHGHIDLSNEALMQLLLYGDKHLSNDLERNIIEFTLKYIHTQLVDLIEITVDQANCHLTSNSRCNFCCMVMNLSQMLSTETCSS